MMHASDLRIGNLVHHKEGWSAAAPINFKDGFTLQWDERHWYMLGECTLSLDIIDPIPLTEEWLLRFDLEKSLHDVFYITDNIFIQYSLSDECWSVVFYTGDHNDIQLSSIKYVHSLQNLFYALTNTELTLN